MRRNVWILVVAALVTGCGGSSSHTTRQRRTSSTHTSTNGTRSRSATTKGAAIFGQAEKCYSIIGDETKFGQDASRLAKGAGNTAADNAAVADIDALKTAIEQIEPTASATQLPVLQQYATVLGRFDRAIEAASSGNLATAAGDLTGAGDEFGQLTPQVNQICTGEISTASASAAPSGTTTATSPPTSADLASINHDFLTILGHCLKVIGGASDPGISNAVSDYLSKFKKYGNTPFRLVPGGPVRSMPLLLKSAADALQSCDPADAATLRGALTSGP